MRAIDGSMFCILSPLETFTLLEELHTFYDFMEIISHVLLHWTLCYRDLRHYPCLLLSSRSLFPSTLSGPSARSSFPLPLFHCDFICCHSFPSNHMPVTLNPVSDLNPAPWNRLPTCLHGLHSSPVNISTRTCSQPNFGFFLSNLFPCSLPCPPPTEPKCHQEKQGAIPTPPSHPGHLVNLTARLSMSPALVHYRVPPQALRSPTLSS